MIFDFFLVRTFAKYYSLIFPKTDQEVRIAIAPKRSEIVLLAFVQATLFGLFILFFSWRYYFIFWVLPLVTIGRSIARIRNIAEHVKNTNESDPILCRLRTIRCNLIEQLLFGPLNFNYHAEHHLFPNVPFYNLPKLFRILEKQEVYRKHVDVRYGYMKTLLSLARVH